MRWDWFWAGSQPRLSPANFNGLWCEYSFVTALSGSHIFFSSKVRNVNLGYLILLISQCKVKFMCWMGHVNLPTSPHSRCELCQALLLKMLPCLLGCVGKVWNTQTSLVAIYHFQGLIDEQQLNQVLCSLILESFLGCDIYAGRSAMFKSPWASSSPCNFLEMSIRASWGIHPANHDLMWECLHMWFGFL